MLLPKKPARPSQTKVLAGEIPRAAKCSREALVALEVVRREAVRRSLSVARGAAATFGTGMKLLDESAEVRIGLPSIFWVGGVHKLVAVVFHLHSAARANHLVSVGHSSHPYPRGS